MKPVAPRLVPIVSAHASPAGIAEERAETCPETPNRIVLGACLGLAAAVFALAWFVQSPYFAVALLAGACIALASLARPSFALFIFVFMLYSRTSEVLVNAVGIPGIAPFYGVLVLLAYLFYYGSGALRLPRAEEWQPIAAYALVMLASVLVAINPGLSFLAVRVFAKEIIYATIIVLGARSLSDLRVITWGLVLAGTFPAVITIYQVVSGSKFQFYGFGQLPGRELLYTSSGALVGRPAGSVGDPNFYALSLVTLISLAFYRHRYEKSRRLKFLALAAAAACGVAAVLTYSRGGLLALGVAVIASMAFGFFRPRYLVIVAAAGLALTLVLPSSYTQRFGSMTGIVSQVVSGGSSAPGQALPTTSDPSATNRLREMTAGFLMFRDHPLIGVGINNYSQYFQSYARPLQIETPFDRTAHSLYAQIPAETGILGVITFLAIIIGLLVHLRRDYNNPDLSPALRDASRAVTVSLLTFFVGSIFLHLAYPRLLWMLVALGLATHAVSHEFFRPSRETATQASEKPNLVEVM